MPDLSVILDLYESGEFDRIRELMHAGDFYFAFADFGDGECFLVTPKQLWDEERVIDDQSVADVFVEALGFSRLTESTYEFGGTFDEGRKVLTDAGFIFNHELVGDQE